MNAKNPRGKRMNKAIMMLMITAGLATAFYACKNDSQTAPPGSGVINGSVIDGATGTALPGVTVTARTTASTQSQPTDAQGLFSFSFSTDSTILVTLIMQKSGYRDTTFTVEISSGTVTIVNVSMSARSPITGGSGSGFAKTIYLVSANPQDISVYGVGGNETAYLVWEVRDGLGLPIDAAHAVTVNFSLNGGLGGGEYVSPPSATSNAQGRVTTSISSGIRSGAVQVKAAIGDTISSQPVTIVIHSGPADQTHFTIGAEKLNFPALFVIGKRDPVSVLVGDIYSNPVATNTAVYLSTTAGVILSSIFTTESGEGTADLISGNPYPVGTNALTPYGNGYQFVRGSTVGSNGTIVKDSVLILWSGASIISNFNPGTINVPNAGFQAIDFQVSDQYGNTLSAPTSISVTVTGVQAEVAFGQGGTYTFTQDIILPPGANTHFSCYVSDSQPDTSYATPATLTVTVANTENGNATAQIGGTIH